MEKYRKLRFIPMVLTAIPSFILILGNILKWNLPVFFLLTIMVIALVWYLLDTILLSFIEKEYISEWIKPDDATLEGCGYMFLRKSCPGNKPVFANGHYFLARGGDKDLFWETIKPTESILDEGEVWLKPLCIIGGFPDIYDWEDLPLELKMSILKHRWLLKMRNDID